MTSPPLSEYARYHPAISLFAIFVLWKSLIVLIVLACPGIGYDTSTSLSNWENDTHCPVTQTPKSMGTQWLKFVRWDAIYFTHLSEHGHVFEQEWAFGIGLSTPMSWIANGLSVLGMTPESSSLTAGLFLSHMAHWLSVIQLWALTTTLLAGDRTRRSPIPFCAAALHILSPAGVFLSAPYSEGLFASLSISGSLGFVRASQNFIKGQVFAGCILMVSAGLAFGTASVIRGNGLLAGIPFLIEALITALAILSQGISLTRVTRLASVIAGGILIAVGMILPQALAYREYCYGRYIGDRRSWCESTIPSIFTFVQSHYWNVGLFRYWTLSNVPLFLLAAPCLGLLTYSAVDVVRNPRILTGDPSKPPSETITIQGRMAAMSLALPQLALAVLGLTSYHVQIITRLSSGYPLWYIWLAVKIQEEPRHISVIVRWMGIYALIQAGLYASFLPPA